MRTLRFKESSSGRINRPTNAETTNEGKDFSATQQIHVNASQEKLIINHFYSIRHPSEMKVCLEELPQEPKEDMLEYEKLPQVQSSNKATLESIKRQMNILPSNKYTNNRLLAVKAKEMPKTKPDNRDGALETAKLPQVSSDSQSNLNRLAKIASNWRSGHKSSSSTVTIRSTSSTESNQVSLASSILPLSTVVKSNSKEMVKNPEDNKLTSILSERTKNISSNQETGLLLNRPNAAHGRKPIKAIITKNSNTTNTNNNNNNNKTNNNKDFRLSELNSNLNRKKSLYDINMGVTNDRLFGWQFIGGTCKDYQLPTYTRTVNRLTIQL